LRYFALGFGVTAIIALAIVGILFLTGTIPLNATHCSWGVMAIDDNAALREYPNLTTLQQWLEQDDTDSHQYDSGIWDCDDFALELQARALASGWVVSIQYDRAETSAHMYNTAKIGNNYYRINPQTDKVRLLCLLD